MTDLLTGGGLFRCRRQEEIVGPGLFESCMSGKVEQLYCLLEEDDIVDPKVNKIYNVSIQSLTTCLASKVNIN